MENYTNTVCKLDYCTGCKACLEICPKQAITINDSLEAYNAVIDETLCINCNQCHNICQTNTNAIVIKPTDWWQGWASDINIREKSSSGGLAQELERAFIRNGGYVCSCRLRDGSFGFAFAETIDEVEAFRGSKYVKSDPTGIYTELRERLMNGQKILFVGLPCQVAAVKKFVGDRLQNELYTIDLICHGTPSPRLLDLFLEQYGTSLKETRNIRFRTKTRFQVEDKRHIIGTHGVRDAYMIAFLGAICYTENCYHCQYAQLERVSDLTLGDSWGSDLSEEEQRKGISLILCQNTKGKELIDSADLNLLPVDLINAIRQNHQLNAPSEKTKKREKFFGLIYKKKRFNCAVRWCYPVLSAKLAIKTILIKIGIKQ